MSNLHGHEWWTGFFERCRDGIYMADLEGNLLAVNPALEEFLGYDETELLGMNVMATVAPEDLAQAGAVMSKLLTDGVVEPFEVGVQRKDGSRVHAEISARVVATDVGPSHIEGVVRDSTDRHGLQEQLREQTAILTATVKELEAAQAVKDEFLSVVSHELRTPLTSIQGYTELLEEEELTSGQREFLAVISRSSDRLLDLVEDLLLMAKIQSGGLPLELGEAILADLISGSAESALPFAESKHIALSVDIEPRLATEGDPKRLGQVIDNLLSNAIKYTPDGGRVSITATHKGESAFIAVSDTGIGIPKQEQARMFNRFFRTSNARSAGIPGTGLGLAITRGIVEAHGGTIGFDSREGEGTTFRVTLPHAHLTIAA